MLEHVFERAKLFGDWTGLYLATCDEAIQYFGLSKDYPVIMTSDSHTRCLDRVAEAAEKCDEALDDDDIVVCVQGDEPLLRPDMIDAVLAPLKTDLNVPCTVLGMHITEESVFLNSDTVKIVHDVQDSVLYTSRSPIPYCKEFSSDLGASRIYGIFAFRWRFLRQFTTWDETPLERKESCDSNRICDLGGGQKVAHYPSVPSFSVDSPEDVHLVEKAMLEDPYTGKY